MEWIDVKTNPPKEIGWYKIKTLYGEFEAPVSVNTNGKLVWVIPDESIITHYKPKEDGQTNKAE